MTKPNPEMIDDENPEWTDEMFARAVRVDDLPPSLRAKLGGRPKVQDPKKVVTLRLRHSLIEQYQALGPDWRLKMEAALTEALAASPR